MDITDVQRFLGHESLTTTRLYAETTAAVLRRKFDQITAPAAHALVATVQHRHGNEAALLAADLLMGHHVERFSPADA
jgi:integrase/recombinase XerD